MFVALTFPSFTTSQKGEARRAVREVFLGEEGSSRIYKLRRERGMNLFKTERAENFLSNQTRLPAEVATATRAAKRLHHVKTGALEKQENQMVVKHRTGKPKSGISVFSGSLGAATLLFAFSFLFLSFLLLCS